MTETEVKEQIKQYGDPTNIIYGDFFLVFSNLVEDDDIGDDFIATLSYNCTINMIDRILNNQSFYVPKFEISQDELDTMQIDYDNMEYIEYPDKYEIDTDNLEMDTINALSR